MRGLAGAAALMWSVAAAGRGTPTEFLKAMTLVDVPLVIKGIDHAGTQRELWVKGDAPANTLLATLTLTPVDAAVLGMARDANDRAVLWRAYSGGGVRQFGRDSLQLDAAPRQYCGLVADRPGLTCMIDRDGDGRFEAAALGRPENGGKPYHVTIMAASAPLPAPLPYQRLSADRLPVVTVELRNCARDYDRPRFSVQSVEDQGSPRLPSMSWVSQDSTLSSCRRAARRDAPPSDTGVVVASGGFVADLGPLSFAVGARQAPSLMPAGETRSGALWRLEGGDLVHLAVGATPDQAKLLAEQQFPEPVLKSLPGGVIRSGTLAPGDTLATVPFEHGYRGRLTRDVTISTLFGKRALPAGTALYGYPARPSITRTVNNIPQMDRIDDSDVRRIDLSITWCAPVRGEPNPAKEARSIARNGWTAACIPQSPGGTHTIIRDATPAFAVTSLRYDVGTSSNDGPAPIQADNAVRFDQPLSLRTRLDSVADNRITLRQEILLGNEVTSSDPIPLYLTDGKAGVTIAGADVELQRMADGSVTATPAGQPKPGFSARTQFDVFAALIQALRRIGAKPGPDKKPTPGT